MADDFTPPPVQDTPAPAPAIPPDTGAPAGVQPQEQPQPAPAQDGGLMEKAMRYFSGAGAMAQETFDQYKNRAIQSLKGNAANPDYDAGNMPSPTELNMEVLRQAAKDGPEAATGAVQHLKAQYEPRRAQAARAIEAGNLPVGAMDATKAMDFVPDNHAINFVPSHDGIDAVINPPGGETQKLSFPGTTLAKALQAPQLIWDHVTQQGAGPLLRSVHSNFVPSATPTIAGTEPRGASPIFKPEGLATGASAVPNDASVPGQGEGEKSEPVGPKYSATPADAPEPAAGNKPPANTRDAGAGWGPGGPPETEQPDWMKNVPTEEQLREPAAPGGQGGGAEPQGAEPRGAEPRTSSLPSTMRVGVRDYRGNLHPRNIDVQAALQQAREQTVPIGGYEALDRAAAAHQADNEAGANKEPRIIHTIAGGGAGPAVQGYQALGERISGKGGSYEMPSHEINPGLPPRGTADPRGNQKHVATEQEVHEHVYQSNRQHGSSHEEAMKSADAYVATRFPSADHGPAELPRNPTEETLVDGKVYNTAKGIGRWSAKDRQFLPIGR